MITIDTLNENFNEVKKVLTENAIFLIKVLENLTVLSKDNPEIFRRTPYGRPKSIDSLINKLRTDKIPEGKLLEGLKVIDDIVGARVTIASQDQYQKAGELMIDSLKDLGEAKLKRRWRWNSLNKKEQTEKGYCADHYVIEKKENINIKCEIQVRTLAHDLWAVFSHSESYKLEEELGESREEEIINYSRLMDASDYYIKLIKRRKIDEANDYNRRHSHEIKGSILTVDSLEKILTNNAMPIKVGKIDIIKICDTLKELADYRIHTEEDLTKVLRNQKFKKALITSIQEVNKENNTKYFEMNILDLLSIAYKCRATEIKYFDAGDITSEMKNTIKGKVKSWYLEKHLQAKINGETYEDDGKKDS